jgi:hypothetical protein
MAIMIIVVPVVILALLDVVALRVGVDSRDEFGDDRSQRYPVGIETR